MPSGIFLSAIIAAIFIAATPSTHAAPPDDACSLVTDAQVSAAVGVSVKPGVYVTPTFKKTCTWNATTPVPQSVKIVTLMLQGLDAYQAGKNTSLKSIIVTPASGIGDDAYYLGTDAVFGLVVKKGSIAFKVAVYADIPKEKKQALEKALAQQVLAKL
jgi:hypothetical protein